jgi:hypothetical protein
MYLPNTGGQQNYHPIFDASGVTVAGTALVMPQHKSRSHFVIVNISDTAMYIEFGSARATATLTSGVVTSTTITNGGFNFTRPPKVKFLGGGSGGNSSTIGCGQPGYPDPGDTGYAWGQDVHTQRPAKGHAILTAGVVTSIVIEDGGSGYLAAPFVFFENDALDPFGCADPFYGSVLSGLPLAPGNGSFYVNGTVCTTDPISVYCATISKAFTAKWTP